VKSTLKLCATSVSAPFTKKKCTATSITVRGEGVYKLANGKVLFDPEPTFTGTVLTPIQYVYSDSAGLLATAKITPTIGERNGLIAVNDAQTTPWDTNQTYSPLTNDAASTSATITESSLKLCELAASRPYTTTNCSATSVTVAGEGVYTLSGATVLFDPEPTFTGRVRTPIQYVYVDSLGLLATAKITPTIGDRVRERLPETGSDAWLLFAMMLSLLIAAFISLRQLRIRN
jgi:CshA-type fibril repeat protein